MRAIIGGTGFYEIDGLEIVEERRLTTPFGEPSAPLVIGRVGEHEVAFLARHGRNHELLPHEVNYRANIWALKSVGALQVVGISAVGSLRREIAPGDLAIASQYLDFVRGPRQKSFFGDGLAAHVSTAEPVCPKLTAALADLAASLKIRLHTDKTYVCVDGPRLGTRAESNFFREAAGGDLVGMTNVPEVFLAREAQLCYCTIGVVTDYDCWLDDPAEHVTVMDVIARYGKSIEKVKRLVAAFLEKEPPEIDSSYREIVQYSLLTPRERLTSEKKQLLEMLMK